MEEPTPVEPWSDANREANARDLGYVGTDLLLLGLAREEGVAGEVLRDLGATQAAIAPVIDQIHASSVASPRPEADEHGRPWHVRATPSAEQARGRATGIAIGLGERESRAHLLLALAYDRAGVHASVLRQVGVSRSAIVEALQARGVAVPPNPPPRDADPTTSAVPCPTRMPASWWPSSAAARPPIRLGISMKRGAAAGATVACQSVPATPGSARRPRSTSGGSCGLRWRRRGCRSHPRTIGSRLRPPKRHHDRLVACCGGHIDAAAPQRA